ncbi:hypothetical protein I3843_08G015200 [Carya illinoinensis]|uniref:Uncharacterized protein n=1 Tax=Carya illinoinensis TaxID=32201 RepID=A0A8T1PNW2_CARIL|nr:uncharacterized protein LOC122319249 [Carya illinoinensis]KAG6643838.1 hypothetical protein CIPAW_08G014500 [Carya illinoinensis]KAG6698324.1 hypothetical protein I3842_08G014700 [Carya illinoinensis]KAG7965723.1 hypothetical protein I3843_08G015200 [Carya illinoinensis]
MAFATSCCLHLPPTAAIPPSKPSLTPKANHQVACRKKNEESWRNRCIIGMASMIIGLEISSNLTIIDETHFATNIAKENMSTLQLAVDSNGQKVARWSDKRSCPAWQENSLETIVPENLPRPSVRRRWEAVGHDSKTAPPVKVIVKTTNRSNYCFSL